MVQENKTYTQIVRVYGIVQGVGFRPFVSRIADRAGVTGSVANKGSYVEIYVRGRKSQMEAFMDDLEQHPPERSAVLKIDVAECEDIPYQKFDIIESEKEEGDIFVSPDIATCPKCRQELYDPSAPEEYNEFVARAALGKALIISAKGGTKEAARAAEFFGYTKTYRRTLRKVRVLNALPRSWRAPLIGLYNSLAWRIARKGL